MMRAASIVILLVLGFSVFAVETNEFVWVQQRIAELQPTAKEKRFDEIGWANDIRDAERLAQAHARPVFLFTHDGRMNIGRC